MNQPHVTEYLPSACLCAITSSGQISQVNIYFRCSVISLWPLGHVHLGHHNSLSLICWGWSGQNLFLMMSFCWFFRLKEWRKKWRRGEQAGKKMENKWERLPLWHDCTLSLIHPNLPNFDVNEAHNPMAIDTTTALLQLSVKQCLWM